MPITKEQLAGRIASDLAHKNLQKISWSNYVSFAANELTTNETLKIVEAAKQGNNTAVGALFNRAVGRRIRALAQAEADAMVADNTLTATELNRWLGDG